MIEHLEAILPKPLSDEVAFELVNVFEALTIVLETHYYNQIQRHIEDNARPIDDPPF